MFPRSPATAPGTLSAGSLAAGKQVPRMGTQGSGRTPPPAPPQLTGEIVFASVPSTSQAHTRPPLPAPLTSGQQQQQQLPRLQPHILMSTSSANINAVGSGNEQQHKSAFTPPPLLSSVSVPDLISAQSRGSERRSGRSRDNSSPSPDVEVVTSVFNSVANNCKVTR